jgi:hypothetical protein
VRPSVGHLEFSHGAEVDRIFVNEEPASNNEVPIAAMFSNGNDTLLVR